MRFKRKNELNNKREYLPNAEVLLTATLKPWPLNLIDGDSLD